jgi:inorganic pyrophosphatase
MLRSPDQIPPFDPEEKLWYVIVETPKLSRNKFTYDDELSIFKLGGVLPRGAVFPFDFGFIPRTRGQDGDPLDVLVLMDEPAFPGCLVACRLIGVIKARQTERNSRKPIRNDRLIAVAGKSREHEAVRSINDLNDRLLEEIEHFFISYNELKGKTFKPIGREGAPAASKLARAGMDAFSQHRG